MPPLIGVTTSEVRRGELATLRRHGEPPQHEMALGLTYVRAIELAGGVPVVLPPLHNGYETLLARLDGICLSGGPDLDPAAYGARAHEQLGPTEPALDRFELELARAAAAAGLPLLGVCRGAQALNVARGGILH
jgi:putative glutamine amidotransferase